MSLPNQSGMTAPPGLGMPPGLNFPGTTSGPSSANVNGIPPQPDLSSIGPHTSSAQLAALLANVGNGPDLNPFASQPQQQSGGFNNNFGSFGNNNFNNNQAPTGTCRMHQQGHCRYGATCRFAHVGPAGGGGGNSFGNQNNNNNFGNNFGRSQPFGNNQNNNNFGGMNNNFMRGGMNVPQQQSSLLQPQVVSQQLDHDKLDASQVGNFNPNAPTFNPTATAAGANSAAPGGAGATPAPLAAAAAAVGGNNALLQALLMQQQLNAASGLPPNADLDNLIKSLAAPAVTAVAAPIQPTNNASNNNNDANLNNEFLAAQAQLASLALGGSSNNNSNNNTNNSRPMQNNFNGPSSMNFNQQHNTPFGNNNNNRYGNQGGFNKFGNNNNMHGHNSHFGGGNFPSAQHGVNQFRDQFNNNYLPGNAAGHVRFHSDASNRDFRREAEIFGPAHSQTTGINFDKYDDIPVEVTGNDIPGEMKAFTDFDFPDVIRQNIELCKYQKPTPIQKYALPVAFLGRDLMACAQTGSGKTAAFLLPFIAHLVINGRPAPQGGNGRNRKYMPVGLILAPTRELATQIWDESLKFVYGTSIHTVVVYGGQDIRQQFRELDRGCDIIIGTPGRLMDFLERGRISLAQISYLCLDEADRMLDMGFEPQIRNIVMQQDMSEQRQTLLFSATFPKEIQRLAGDFMFNYVFIAVGRVGSSSDFITQSVDWVPEEDKRTQLMKYLPTFKGLTLIFVERKKSADLLETYLNREGFHAASIHGDRSQHERETALAMFRNGRCPILVATDVAARGLDIPTLSNVVNFDMPTSIDDYVHRIGRTGRAGNSGNAWSFVNEKSSHLFKELYEMLHENKQVVPQWLAQVVESRGHNRQAGGGKKFGGRDYRAGGYGNHKGGRGGMAQHNLGKRFAQNNNNQNNQMQGMMNFQQSGNQGFPSSSSNAGGFQGNVMRPNQPAGNFNLAAAMTGRTFPAGPQ